MFLEFQIELVLVNTKTPEKTEFELMKAIPKKRWSHATSLINLSWKKNYVKQENPNVTYVH